MAAAQNDESGNVIQIPVRQRRLRADVAPFDPNNPKHIEAWEILWDFALHHKKWGFDG